MIHCIIIDDENNCIEMLEWQLKTYCPNVVIDASCDSAEKGITAINKFEPDVVFLDIEMPKMNGFEMLKKFDKLFFDVVFTTAYNQFALNAFKFSALNYLLKPIDIDDLKSTVEKVEQKNSQITREQFDLLLQKMDGVKHSLNRIALTTYDGLVFVTTSDIIHCDAESNYTNIFLANGDKILVSKTLKEIDETLSGGDFFRIHNSHLININHIKKFVRGDGGYVVMSDNVSITISRSRREEFFEMFSKF